MFSHSPDPDATNGDAADIESRPEGAAACPGCAELKAALKVSKDEQVRAWAETENVKKRLTREKEEFCKYAEENLLNDLFPVLDNLDLALDHAGAAAETCKDFVVGVEMTRKLFLDKLADHGVESLGQPGEAFNPEIHEAVGFESRSDYPDGFVCRVLQRGYRLKGRLIRPCRAFVNKSC